TRGGPRYGETGASCSYAYPPWTARFTGADWFFPGGCSMNDKNERTEHQAALELDALLDNWLAGRTAAAPGESKLSAEDQTFARQMVTLAQETEPDPDFVLQLENRLRWAARQNAAVGRREATPPRRLFW